MTAQNIHSFVTLTDSSIHYRADIKEKIDLRNLSDREIWLKTIIDLEWIRHIHKITNESAWEKAFSHK